MARSSIVGSLALFGVLLVLQPLGVLCHELGHALTAKRFGARVNGVVATSEGPAVLMRIAGIPASFGLGLTRDLRSREPVGWAIVVVQDLTRPQAVAVLRAGPITQAIFGLAVVLVVLALPLAILPTVPFVMTGVSECASGLANLRPGRRPESDGSRIAALQAWQQLIASGVATERPTHLCLEHPIA